MTPTPPAQVEPIVRILGVQGAVDFLLTFGGAELYLTQNPKNRSRVVATVGREKAVELATAMEFLPSRIPTAKPWLAAVHQSWGLPVAEIARKLHVTDVTVRSYLKRYGGTARNPQQPTLPGF